MEVREWRRRKSLSLCSQSPLEEWDKNEIATPHEAKYFQGDTKKENQNNSKRTSEAYVLYMFQHQLQPHYLKHIH